MEMMSSGKPIAGTDVKIVDSDGNALPERHVGEIVLRGNSMLTGYYHLPEATEKVIRDGWYFTGDLGYLADGELFVSGRMKDLIIVGGKNIYPQDIESILNEIEGIKAGRTVAFGVFNDKLGTEDIGVVAELEDESDEARARIQREVRQQVVQALDVNARYIHLVDAMWLIKTSSGKIARSANRDKFLVETGLE
jgi:acyl-CoA synthetase (AMP-forming)/AMP-acid ligase II